MGEVKNYNKLIRDKILEIIEEAGEKPYHRVLEKEEYLQELKKKVLEEAKELIEAKSKDRIINEVVDIQEIIDNIITEIGLTREEIKKEQEIKNEKRGGFKKRLFLIRTIKE
jgi:predicted house-cleaning noncanonical NTP pyrophosphatase (MazG superfamily)